MNLYKAFGTHEAIQQNATLFCIGCRQAHSVGAVRLGAECIQLSKNSVQPLS